jgi:hypothetical protein
MGIEKTKRRGFTWDPEFKDYVARIRDSLKESGSVEMGNKELFFLCVAIGVKEKVTRDVPPRKTDSARLEDLRSEDYALLKSLVISENGSSDVLLEEDRVYDRIEQYAAGGLSYLSAQYDSSPDFKTDLVAELHRYVRKMNPA